MRRSHDTPSLKLLQKVTRCDPPSGEKEREEFLGAIGSGVPVVMKMVNEVTIVLKNKEEKMVFSDPAHHIGEMRALLSHQETLEASIRTLEERFLMHPLCREKDRLDKDYRDLCENLERESALLKEDERRIAHARSAVPVETDRIERIIQDITGKVVVLQI
jgi:hypothetical protein